MTRARFGFAIALAIGLAHAAPAAALPTMIRIGYTNCAACHVAPQGGGMLTEYGQGIDQAQSLRGGELQRVQDLHRRLM
jgi:mono/diheme cytochrome c family protein